MNGQENNENTKRNGKLVDLYHHNVDEHTMEGCKYGILREAAFRGPKNDIERVSEIVKSKEYRQINEVIYELLLRPTTIKEINSVFDAIENVPNCKVALYFNSKWSSQTVGSQSGYPFITYVPSQPDYHAKEDESDWWYGSLDPKKAGIGWDEMDFAGKELDVVDGLLIRNGVLEGYIGLSDDVVVPGSVSIIGVNAFYRCGRLKNVTISDGVTSIEQGAFCGCKNLMNVAIPNSVNSIGACAFEGCSSLTGVTISNNMTMIAWKLFLDCSSLTSVTIPDSVIKIDNYAFQNCKSLLSVTIPEKVEYIGTGVFNGCSSLTSVRSPKMICHEMIRSKSCFILLITRGKTLSYFAFASKADSDNLTDFAKSGSWSMYDQELINNGPKYKYKMPVRLVGALGRLLDPKELTEENRDKLTELISKNVKKIIPIAASLNSPEIVQALFDFGFVNKKNEKAIRKLLEDHNLSESGHIFIF